MSKPALKWCFLTKDGPVYHDTPKTVRMFVGNARTLMLFKNPSISYNEWVVCDYLTGVKLASAHRKNKAAELLNNELAIRTAETVGRKFSFGVLEEVNKGEK